MTRKLTKTISIIALCVVMLATTILPTFASSIVLVEDHSVVDCTHYYKENGNYYFQIKYPKGDLTKVDLALLNNSNGYAGGSVSFKHGVSGIFELRDAYSDDTYDYKWFVVKCSEYPNSMYSSWNGFGIKIFYFNGENSKMATNTANGSSTQGNGYWLSK